MSPFLAAAAMAFVSASGHAQEVALTSSAEMTGPAFSTSAMPDEPVQQPDASATPEHKDPQTKRILGILPNFRSVSKDEKLPPQTVKDKFITASEDSFDYSSIVLPAAIAAEGYLANDVPEFGKGGVGYGRYLWHSVVDQTVENYMVEFVVPALTHEDTRFYTLGRGGFLKRAGYSLSRAVITRTDSGKATFNVGEIAGAGIASGLSNLYYPAPERTVSNTMQKFGTNVGVDAFTFFFKEFWPDINHKLFHGAKPGQ